MKLPLILLLVLSSLPYLTAQDYPPEVQQLLNDQEGGGVAGATDTTEAALDPHLEVIAKYTAPSGALHLRWSPTTPDAWLAGNYYGYRIERLDLGDDGSGLFELVARDLKPLDLDGWKALDAAGQPTDHHLVAAEMLYGGHLEALVSDGPNVAAGQRLLEYFSVVMLSADLSWPTAEGLALGYVDRTATPGREYLYRVRLQEQPTDFYVREGVTTIRAAAPEFTDIPKIAKVRENENGIALLLPRDYHESRFTGLYFERTDSGSEQWTRLNERPFVHATNAKLADAEEWIIYSDSLSRNYQAYRYRVIGHTPFGTLSPPSAPVTAMGRDRTPPTAPANVATTTRPGPRVEISWEFPTTVGGDLAGFVVARSNQSLGHFEPLTAEPLPAWTRSFVDANPDTLGSNYYMVAAVDTAGNGTPSLVSHALIIDSLPPTPPTALGGSIDTNGIVTLNWEANPELDVIGYQVYFAHQGDHVFAGLTPRPIQALTYEDTITIRSLKRDIFYYIVAVDRDFNYSATSDTVRLIKPDMVPPAPPVLSELKVSPEGIVGQWIPSSSEDVAGYEWLRRPATDGDIAEWQAIKSWAASESVGQLLDRETTSGQRYEYTIRCTDESGLVSDLPFILTARGPLGVHGNLAITSATFDPEKRAVTLAWPATFTGPEARIRIFRATDGGYFDQVKSIPADQTGWIDRAVSAGKKYEYAIKVTGGGRLASDLSVAVEVNSTGK